MFNLGNDNQKGSLGIIELFKARVGEILVYGGEVFRYLLNLSTVFGDYFKIPQSEALYTVPSTGVFEFGINCILPIGAPVSLGFLGYSKSTPDNLTFYLFVAGNNLQFVNGSDSQNWLVVSNFRQQYEGKVARIRVGYYSNDQIAIFINEERKAYNIKPFRPSGQRNPNEGFLINAIGDNNPNLEPFQKGGLTVISWFINGDKFLLPEGNGFVTTSESGINATGQTDNPLQLSYWDSVVWGLNKFFYLNFNATNENYSFIPQTEKVYSVPATGDFRFGIKIKVASTVENRFQGLIGYDPSSGSPFSKFGFFIRNTGGLSFSNGNDSTFSTLTLDNFEQDYAGQIVEIIGEYFDGGLRILINGNIEATSGSSVRPSIINSNIPFRIGIRGNSDGTGITSNSGFNGEIYSWFIDNDYFNTIQNEGFETISSLGTIATGSTNQTLENWNSNVIQEILPPRLLNFNATNENYSFIPQTEKVYTVPATGDFRFGIKIKVASTVESRFKGLLGYDSSSASRFSLFINTQGLLAFVNANDSDFTSVTLNNFEQDYAGQIVEIIGEYFDGGLRILINGNIEATSGSSVRPSTINSNIPFRIGVRGGTGITSNSGFNGEIYSWFIDDDYFNTIQNEGFETISSLGTTSTGSTNQTLENWNSNVIKEILPPRLLNFNATNQDYSFIPQTEKVYNVPATGDYSFGIKIKVAPTVENRFKGLLGYDPSGSLDVGSRFGLYINPTGLLVFSNSDGSSLAVTTSPNFEQDYAGQIVEIIGEYFDGGLRILINGNIEATSASSVRPSTVNSNIPFRIGVRGNSDGTGITNSSFFTGQIYSWFIGNDYFNTIQSEGFETVSSLGTTSTGSTNQTLEDWDNEVIEII